MDRGLWRYSRHPNYFFQTLTWVAYALIAVAAPWGWLAFFAPALILYLVLFVTGVPPAEESSLRSRGDAYRRYQARDVAPSCHGRRSTRRPSDRVGPRARPAPARGHPRHVRDAPAPRAPPRAGREGGVRRASALLADRASRSRSRTSSTTRCRPSSSGSCSGRASSTARASGPTASRRSPPPRRRCSR